MGIVERLRKRREHEVMPDGYIRVEWEDEDALEAADEIERLREALKKMEDLMDGYSDEGLTFSDIGLSVKLEDK